MDPTVREWIWNEGDVVRRLREERKLSQEELAEVADVGISTVQRIEDRKNYRKDSLDRIAKALGTSAAVLLAEAPIRPSELVRKAIEAGLEDLRGHRVDLAMNSIRVILRGQHDADAAAQPRKRSRG